ncbi:TIGR01244 family sulfur transferase [Rhodanobacter umsongensis]
MQIHRLTEQFSVAAQISPDDIAGLVAAGFRSLINNRPDGEAQDQPASALLADVAAAHGVAYRYLPVVSGQLCDQDAVDFSTALRSMPPPVLAFCRSGTRSCSLWVLQAGGEADAVLDTARRAGYDLQSLRPKMLRGGR